MQVGGPIDGRYTRLPVPQGGVGSPRDQVAAVDPATPGRDSTRAPVPHTARGEWLQGGQTASGPAPSGVYRQLPAGLPQQLEELYARHSEQALDPDHRDRLVGIDVYV